MKEHTVADTPTPRTALVTGAGRGIGRGIAIALGGAGFRVAINYAANADAARECADLVQQAGGEPLTIQADISDERQRTALAQEVIAAFGRIDLLVNNAGVAPKTRDDLLAMSEESFRTVLETNLVGPFFLTQLLAAHMVEHRHQYPADVIPAIINISSISAYTASVNRGEYCISKAGIAMMTALFAARLAEHGIHVYEIRPGIIATDMTAPGTVKAKYDKLILEEGLLPIKRWGQPEDIGKAVLAIAQGLLPYSTGQVLDVDGGFHLRRL
jgi:3-oxoacyl-[acyl-carrier protein] reductase